MKDLIIIGAGGHGKVVLDIALKMNKWNNIYFLDDLKLGNIINGHKVIDTIENYKNYDSNKYDFFVAIGNNSVREKMINELIYGDYNLPIIIDKFTSISENIEIGKGTVIMPGVVINTNTKIGIGVILNTSSTIDHDCNIGNYVHISPGVNIGGTSSVENNSWMCIGSTVINNINIGKNVIVAAGGVVIKDIEKNILVGGVPARKIRDLD